MLLCRSSSAEEWYKSLRPGVTRSDVLKLAGKPSSSGSDIDTYTQAKGRIECKYEKASLRSVIYYDTPDGAVAWTLYSTDGESKESDLERRRAYLKAANFKVMPEFSGKKIYTHKYRGTSYELDDGFIVVEPIIDLLGGRGFFADKTARVLWLNHDGQEKVLYRAADHWGALKPPGLPDNEVQKRIVRLKNAASRLLHMNVTNVLGQSDSVMGSGIDYRLFYLEDGLAVVSCAGGNAIESISVLKPGLTNLSLDEWLKAVPPRR